MNSNPGIQNVATLGWDGATARPMDISKFVRFGFSFEVTAAIAAAAVFKVQSAPPSAADKCVPGAFTDVLEITICQAPAAAGALAQFTIPVGTAIGTVCAGTIPCRPDVFVRLAPVSGDTANVRAVNLRQGPMI